MSSQSNHRPSQKNRSCSSSTPIPILRLRYHFRLTKHSSPEPWKNPMSSQSNHRLSQRNRSSSRSTPFLNRQ